MHTETIHKKVTETSKLSERKNNKLVAKENNDFFKKKAEKAQAFLTKNGFPDAITKSKNRN
jgi:hypothetical protein